MRMLWNDAGDKVAAFKKATSGGPTNGKNIVLGFNEYVHFCRFLGCLLTNWVSKGSMNLVKQTCPPSVLVPPGRMPSNLWLLRDTLLVLLAPAVTLTVLPG